MDPPLINNGSFSTANPSLLEFWPFISGGSNGGDADGGLLGLRVGSDGFVNGLIDGIVNGSGGAVGRMMIRDGSIEESSVTGQSGSLGGVGNGNARGGAGRKRRENVSEDESSKLVSTTSSGNELVCFSTSKFCVLSIMFLCDCYNCFLNLFGVKVEF